MKRASTFILILLLLTQTFSHWLIVLEYRINKDYIARNLCENRTKPVLRCEGKCQLSKKLAAEEKKGVPSENAPSKLKINDPWWPCDSLSPASPQEIRDTDPLFPDFLITPYSAPLQPVFHPPALA